MEETYPIESYPNVSQMLNFNSYFTEYKNLLKKTLFSNQAELEKLNTDEEKIAFQLGIDMDEYNDLEERCSISLLQSDPLEIGDEKKPTDSDGMLEMATKFLGTAVELKALKSCELKYENKLRDLRKAAIPQFEQEQDPSPVFKLHENYVVIARVFRPFRSNMGLTPAPHVQDFKLLGSQKLTEFRAKITCMNDDVLVTEKAEPIKNHMTSCAFLFGNTFYCNENEATTNISYGAVIDKWAKENPEMRIGPFEHKNMEDQTIGDLKIRLGYPYVFIHLGNCEHIITFMDARLMDSEDLQKLDEYPLVVESGNTLMYCGACDVHDSSYYVEDDSMPTKPMNLCDNCFSSYYKRNGKIPPSNDEVYYRKLPAKESVQVQPQEEEESEDD